MGSDVRGLTFPALVSLINVGRAIPAQLAIQWKSPPEQLSLLMFYMILLLASLTPVKLINLLGSMDKLSFTAPVCGPPPSDRKGAGWHCWLTSLSAGSGCNLFYAFLW